MSRSLILIVDDKKEGLYFLRCLLQGHGHEVICAANGIEALASARQNPPHAVISDILMPGMDGFTLCREWKKDERLKIIPFVFYTATYTDERDRSFALSLGAEQFIIKPQEPEVFMDMIRESLEHVASRDAGGGQSPIANEASLESEAASLKQYNEVLIRKLESKMEQLERVNHELQQDIAMREKTEEELRAAKIKAERAMAAAEEATRSKDMFIATLSHELRTPLSPILSAVQLMERNPAMSEESRRQLEIIHRNLRLEARLIDDLLDLTRIVRGKIELERKPIELGALIERVVETCRTEIEARKLHFGVEIRGLHPVNGDESRLQQVIWNLLQNALKFTPEGGDVRVRCYREGGQTVTEVSDSGVGIEPEVLPRLFSAFEQGNSRVTRQFGGLGLGLAISKRLVELHGGAVSANSNGKGKGATFRIMLPLSEMDAADDEKQRVVSTAKVRGRRILLVEDHGDTALMMQALLQSAGYEVETAPDVQQALKIIHLKQFDLLISDLGLPDRSGLDLMKELRQGGSGLKGIALTGFGREEDIGKSKEAGFSSHITKPVEFDVLMHTIETLSD